MCGQAKIAFRRYVLAYLLARRGAISKALVLTLLEVVGHAVATTLIIGWNSGFRYYLAFLIPIAVTSAIRSPWIGVATVGAGESADQAIALADSALYKGKRAGRNRVTPAPDATEVISQPA